jgi:hypothetical protein
MFPKLNKYRCITQLYTILEYKHIFLNETFLQLNVFLVSWKITAFDFYLETFFSFFVTGIVCIIIILPENRSVSMCNFYYWYVTSKQRLLSFMLFKKEEDQ